MPPGARIQPDGSIILPKRGIPPDCNLEGYEVDEQDPYRWNLKLVECRFRTPDKPFKCANGRIGKADFCELLQIKTTRAICYNCPKREVN